MRPPELFRPLTSTETSVPVLAGGRAIEVPTTTPNPVPTTTPRPNPSSGLLARVEQNRRPNHHSPAPARFRLEPAPPGAATGTSVKARAARRGKPRVGTLHKLLITSIVMAAVGSFASGTLATFSAQTRNASNSFATGTLVMSNSASYVGQTTTSGALSTAGAITSLPVAPLTDAVVSGWSVVLVSGANTQTFTAGANAAVGATSITVASQTPNFAYPIGTTVTYRELTAVTTTTASIASGAAIASLSVSNLPKAVNSGSTITLSNGVQSMTMTASATAAPGSTSITVTSGNANATYGAGSTVTYNLGSASACFSTGIPAPGTGTFTNGNSNSNCDFLGFASRAKPGDSPSTANVTVKNAGSLTGVTLSLFSSACAASDNSQESYHGAGDPCTVIYLYVQEWSDANFSQPSHCWYGTVVSGVTCGFQDAPPSPNLSNFVSAHNSTGTALVLANGLAASGSAGDTRYFTIGMKLPQAADNTYQGRAASIDFTWFLNQN